MAIAHDLTAEELATAVQACRVMTAVMTAAMTAHRESAAGGCRQRLLLAELG
jgi:hypothetical protein